MYGLLPRNCIGQEVYNIIWNVVEVINGPGEHDGGVRDGDISYIANGKVQRDGVEADLRIELTEQLEKVFPRNAVGPTYNIHRFYNIEIILSEE